MQIQVKKYIHFLVKVGYFEFTIPVSEGDNYAILRNSVLNKLENLDVADKSALATKITSLILNSK